MSQDTLATTHTLFKTAHKQARLLIYFLTYSMEQSRSSEVNRFSAFQEIPLILWSPKAYYRTYKFPPPLPVVNQLDPVHAHHIPFSEYPS